MNNAQPNKKSADIIEFPRSRSKERLYTELVNDAQKRGARPCLAIFRANEKLYGLYGTGRGVAGSLRGLSPRADFKGLGFEELADVYMNPKLQELSHDAVEELVKQKSQKYSSEPVLVFFADEKGPESLYDDEPVQIGEDT
jgi:hypothetical protein